MKVFIGWDPTQQEAFEVAEYTIRKHTPDVSIIKLDKTQIQEYDHMQDHRGSTAFTYSRFFVPYLCDYKGYAAFVDCDIIARSDLNEMMRYVDPEDAVTCVQHDYTPKSTVKMDGQKQTTYPRKNWSSVMIFNCEHHLTKKLTPDTINGMSGQYLHRMVWAENKIGDLFLEWNCLAGYYDLDSPKIIHYTDGGPWLEEYKDCEFSELWHEERKEYEKTCLSSMFG